MNITQSIRSTLYTIAKRLGLTVQDDKKSKEENESMLKAETISFTDMMTGSLADTQCLDFTLPIKGDTVRSMWLDKVADRFVNLSLINTVQETFNTGDTITVPSWNGRNIQNHLVQAQNFVITKRYGNEITGLIYLAETHKTEYSTYELYQSIELQEYTDELGGTTFLNVYKPIVVKDGNITDLVPSAVTSVWAAFDEEWFIPGVDRLLIGRLKAITSDPKRPNPVKGIPICIGAKKPIAELHYLYDQFHDEFELSEKTVFAAKQLFEARSVRKPNGTTEKRSMLPRGRQRVVQEVNDRSLEGSTLMHEYSPDIRVDAYDRAIQIQYKLFENCVGVSEGVVSRIETANYENVDNVRKSMRKTQAFISSNRAACEQYLEDLVYAWDVLANYYEITPQGAYEISYNWSDEYINTFADRRDGLVQGYSIGAVSPEDYREWMFNEAPETAAEKVAAIQKQNAAIGAAGMSGLGSEGEAVAGGSESTEIQEIAISLSPTQFAEAMKMLDRYNAGDIDREDTIERLSLLGVTRAKAERLLKQRVSA